MSSEDVIYILVGIGWLLYVFLRKSRNKAIKKSSAGHPEISPFVQQEEKSFFEKIFTSDMPGDLYSNVSWKEQENTEAGKVSVPEDTDQTQREHQNNLEHRKIDEHTEMPSHSAMMKHKFSDTPACVPEQELSSYLLSEQQADIYSTKEEQIRADLQTEDFDLRDAVIYYEILKRPKYILRTG